MIPGTMADPAFVVRGLGQSAEFELGVARGGAADVAQEGERHVSGFKAVRKDLEQRGVHVLAAGSDEVPGVYKDIREVMAAQEDLGGDRRAVRSEDREDVRRREPGGGLELANAGEAAFECTMPD